jgi:hypothetical protein
MKKRNLILVICLVILAIASLVIFFFPRDSKAVEIENLVYYDKVYLDENDTTLGSFSIDLIIDLPTEYKKTDILNNIKTILKAELFGEIFMSVPDDSVLGAYANDLIKDYIEVNKGFADRIEDDSRMAFNNTVILEGFALLNDSQIFSYGISHFVDFGGAHPNRTRLFYNFDLKTGNVIFEEDIFKDGFTAELTEILKQKLSEDLSEQNINRENSLNITDYFVDEIKPNHNFYINDESICYVFNPYEIAPYYIGETEINLPYSMIKHLLKQQNPINYLVDNINN